MKIALVSLVVVFACLAHSSEAASLAPKLATEPTPPAANVTSLGQIIEKLFLTYFGHPHVAEDLKKTIAKKVPIPAGKVINVTDAHIDKTKLIKDHVKNISQDLAHAQLSKAPLKHLDKDQAADAKKDLAAKIETVLSKHIEQSHDALSKQVVDVAHEQKKLKLKPSTNTTGRSFIGGFVKGIVSVVHNLFTKEAKAGAKKAAHDVAKAVEESIKKLTTKKPDAKKVTKKPDAKKVTKKPDAKKVTKIPDAKKVTKKPVAKKVTKKPEE